MAKNNQQQNRQAQQPQPSAEEQIKETPAPAEVTEIEQAPKKAKAKKPNLFKRIGNKIVAFGDKHPVLSKVLGTVGTATLTAGLTIGGKAVVDSLTKKPTNNGGFLEVPTDDQINEAQASDSDIKFGEF